MYDGSQVDLGRSDSINLYSDAHFTQTLQRFTPQSSDWSLRVQGQSLLAIHMHANAANGDYGFIAEIVVVPSLSQPSKLSYS